MSGLTPEEREARARIVNDGFGPPPADWEHSPHLKTREAWEWRAALWRIALDKVDRLAAREAAAAEQARAEVVAEVESVLDEVHPDDYVSVGWLRNRVAALATGPTP